MTEIGRVRTVFAGFDGGPGLMTHYFSVTVGPINQAAADLMAQRVLDALNAGAELWPGSFSATVESEVVVLETETGTQLRSYPVAGGVQNGGNIGIVAYGPLATGLCVTWLTDEFRNGRRVLGKSFLVPMVNWVDNNGSPRAESLATANAFGDAMLDAGTTDVRLVVWGRPVNGAGGIAPPVVSHRIRDKFAVLRSRRD